MRIVILASQSIGPGESLEFALSNARRHIYYRSVKDTVDKSIILTEDMYDRVHLNTLTNHSTGKPCSLRKRVGSLSKGTQLIRPTSLEDLRLTIQHTRHLETTYENGQLRHVYHHTCICPKVRYE